MGMKQRSIKNLFIITMIALSGLISSCDQCEGINCSNGGTCEKGECECPDGFSGDRCEFEDKCVTNPVTCQNGGYCLDGKCECPEGYEGNSCQNEDLCLINEIECENGGDCVDGECDCPPNYSGSRCQYYTPPEPTDTIDPCDTIVCENDRPCEDGSCACDEWTSGTYCEHVVIDKYVNGTVYTGAWYNASTFDYLSDGTLEFVDNEDGLDMLDLEYEIVGQNLSLYLEFNDTISFDIPEQPSGNFTISGEGEWDGFEWYVEIFDGSQVYFFDPD